MKGSFSGIQKIIIFQDAYEVDERFPEAYPRTGAQY